MLRLFLLLVLRFSLGYSQSNVMDKYVVLNSNAACNDGSRAVYYAGLGAPSKWVIFLESGAYCSSEAECRKRFQNRKTKTLMTSKYMPNQIEGRDLLSALRKENPAFYDYCHVLIPYCSSDLWLGTKTTSMESTSPYNGSVPKFVFGGKTIFRSVMFDLLSRGLLQAREIVLVGSSAGAIGVLNNVELFFEHTLLSRGLESRVSVIIDGGWFINFRESLSSKLQGKSYDAGATSRACADYSYGFPCCFSASCMLMRGYYPSDIPTLFVLSLYDIYIVADVLQGMAEQVNVAKNSFSDLLTLIGMYGGAMNQSLASIKGDHLNISYFAASCFQHTFFSMSSLRDKGQLLHYSKVVTQGNVVLNLSKQSETWKVVTIPYGAQYISLQSAVTRWAKSRGQPVRMFDSCLGVLCNPTCPDKLVFIDSAEDWGQLVNAIVLLVSLVSTVVCVVLKITVMVQFFLLQGQQNRHVAERDSSQMPFYQPVEAVTIDYVSISIPENKQNPLSQYRMQDDVLDDEESLSVDQDSRGELCVETEEFKRPVVSARFRGGDFVAVVGRKGAGKTMFLNLLSKRVMRRTSLREQLFVNGIDVERIQEYTNIVGFVCKSTVPPYCGEVNVRQYLLLAAHLRRDEKVSKEETLQRVEEIISQLNLCCVADKKLSDSLNFTKLQIRLLHVASQLVTRPLAIFLDEPIRGLDLESSFEILSRLKSLCDRNLLVVVTLQTPVEEVLQRFDMVVILCDKQVIYSGTKSALLIDFATIQEVGRDVNIGLADVISHIVNNEELGFAMATAFHARQPSGKTNFQQHGNENHSSLPSAVNSLCRAGVLNRVLVVETLVVLSISTAEALYLPIMFTIFGTTAGIVFWQSKQIVPIITAYSGSTLPSLLFLSSDIIIRVQNSLAVRKLEHSHSVSFSCELVVQTFLSTSASCIVPVVTCSALTYVMVMTSYDWWGFVIVTVISLVLNQTWIAMYMLIIFANPKYARHGCLFAAILAGFATGFIIPRYHMPLGYNLLFYINPQFYGFSSIIKALLRNVRLQCEYESILNCIDTFGNAVLSRFEFDVVNPFAQLLILLSITMICLVLSWLLLETKTRRAQFSVSCIKPGAN